MTTGPLQLHLDTHHGPRHLPVELPHRALPLADLLRRANLPLNTRCGGRGRCEGCLVELLSGTLTHCATGQPLSADSQPLSLRACAYRLADDSPVSLRIPARSALAYEPQVVTDYRINVPYAHNPVWQQIEIPLAGNPDRPTAVVQTLAAACDGKPVRLSPRAAAQLAYPAADHPWATCEYRGDHWLVTQLSPSAEETALGVAVDIGTTTVALLLVDLRHGRILARAAGFNQQINLGDDVVTRITLCSSSAEMLRELQKAVTDRTIRPLVAEALTAAGLSDHPVHAYAIAGNTTMLHLLAGTDPTPMGIAPFTPEFLAYRTLAARAVFEHLCPPAADAPAPTDAALHLLPGAAAYVGADLTAGILASGLAYDDGPSLLVDVGTNGEIILKQADRMLGCATAAGPAFEGSGLTCGMRAGNGAIAHLQLKRDPFTLTLERIGQSLPFPTGICGSAYVDFLAEARRVGLLNELGRFDPAAVPGSDRHFITWGQGERAFLLAEGQGRRPIVITEADVARLLAAKAAVAAGITILLKRAGVEPRAIARLYLAGGFGTHMIAANAIRCGLLPGFSAGQILPVGNTALAGAFLALLDSGALDEMSRLARTVEIVELNHDPEFENTYIDNLLMPPV